VGVVGCFGGVLGLVVWCWWFGCLGLWVWWRLLCDEGDVGWVGWGLSGFDGFVGDRWA